jgi:plastocyanin
VVALRIGASAQATPQPNATSNPPAGVAPASSAGQLTVGTPASDPLSFDTTTLQATAGAQVTLQYTNNSTLPHDWHLFDGPDANAPSIAQTPIKSGPGDVETVQFTAPPQPGSYFYQCDVHPTMMTGHLVVN